MDLADAFAYAEHTLEQHGLHGWTVAYDGAKRRAGVCRFDRREIGLSAPLTALHPFEQVRDTVLHEVAHALVGARHGHDEVWRRAAVAIGCSGERCVPEEAPRVDTPWLGACPAGHTAGRHRRPERVMTCARCSRSFDLAHLIEWTHHGRPAEHHPNYLLELERLRAGARLELLAVGARGQVTVPGRYAGHVGVVLKRGRTCYHLRAGRQVLRVSFAGVEPA